MSRITDLEICDCSCHESGGHAMHIIACCERCPDCGRRIRAGSDNMNRHREKCPAVHVQNPGEQ
jgi:hypothetical protein